MAERVIPLIDQRMASLRLSAPTGQVAPTGPWKDLRGRPLRDLRISVTDRCNFRCRYCMPKEVFDLRYKYLRHDELLSFEEIERVARIFVGAGVRKIRLTGGEPLLRKDIETLVGRLAALCDSAGRPIDLTLTTNGSLLARKALALRNAGLRRVTVSLDALDDAVFKRMNDVDYPVGAVLDGIEAAQAVGLAPLKVNMVVKRGTNEQEVPRMAEFFRGTGIALRFIEYMDVGATNQWHMDEVCRGDELLAGLQARHALRELPPVDSGETARRWGYVGSDGRVDPGLGEIGFINSVTEPFCGQCNRARLSTDGQIFTCLFGNRGHDLRALLRGAAGQQPADDHQIAAALAGLWQRRADRYSELRGQDQENPAPGGSIRRVEMSFIGG